MASSFSLFHENLFVLLLFNNNFNKKQLAFSTQPITHDSVNESKKHILPPQKALYAYLVDTKVSRHLILVRVIQGTSQILVLTATSQVQQC